RDEERLAFLRERLIAALRRLGRMKLETRRYRVSVYQSGQPPVELRVPVEALPDELVRIERKPDLRAIRQALEEGRIGEDVAVLGERKWSVRIS
ncbi:siphovirus Gp157 family protein, partial [Rhodothermus marinus]